MADSISKSNDQFAHALAAFDELLGACGPDSPLIASVEFELGLPCDRQRLQRGADCLRLLEAVWPGARRRDNHSLVSEEWHPSLIFRAAG